MYPFRDKVIKELTSNGYKVTLQPETSIITISWE